MLQVYLQVLAAISGLVVLTWLYSLQQRNVNIVDSLWSLMFLVAAVFYISNSSEANLRSLIIVLMISLWAIRLSAHLAVRNWGQPEDRRYQEIRDNNEPNFNFKSLYIIFGLQGLLAWIISIPLLFTLYPTTGFHWLDIFAITLWLFGFAFESISDWQLFKFQKNPENKGKTLAHGLWRYSRHPNYFGEFCIWWSFYLLAIPTGGWWTIYAPLLVSFLLLKVSGVALTEKNMSERRPDYQSYIEKTNVFFPSRPLGDSQDLTSKGSAL